MPSAELEDGLEERLVLVEIASGEQFLTALVVRSDDKSRKDGTQLFDLRHYPFWFVGVREDI